MNDRVCQVVPAFWSSAAIGESRARMEKFRSAIEMVKALEPDLPVFAARPHAAGRAARWFTKNFPG